MTSIFEGTGTSGYKSRAIPRVVTVCNQKGGVGKTTVVSNLGGILAEKIRVLVIDLDPQGNLRRDFGYKENDGKKLMSAFLGLAELPILKNVRPNLDVIPSGIAMASLPMSVMANRSAGGPDLGEMLYSLIEPIADDYDLILIDTPPGDLLILEAALQVSKYVVITTKPDEGSKDGVKFLGQTFSTARNRNPELLLLGVVLFAIGERTRRMYTDTRRDISEMLGESAEVFNSAIKDLSSGGVDSRKRGLLFHELEGAAEAERVARLKALRNKAPGERIDGSGNLYSSNPASFAQEFEDLAQEVLTRIAAIEAAELEDSSDLEVSGDE